MNEAQKRAFAARMRGAAVKSRSASTPPATTAQKPFGSTGTDDDTPF
jgi:hypothetical protein